MKNSVLKNVLAIESSCDDTSVAVLDEWGSVLAWEQTSQVAIHNQFGGVVPEVASRFHEKSLLELCTKVLAQVDPKSLACVFATSGPGLVGPLLVGRCFAEGLARSLGVPCRGVHHLRGHVASAFLSENNLKTILLKDRQEELLPALVLLVSGGHTQLLEVKSGLFVKLLADTADDSAGECFDKVAKLLGLGYPGGPAIEAKALSVDRRLRESEIEAILKTLPRPRSEKGFSFSGLKTAARLWLEKNPAAVQSPEVFCAAFQDCIADALSKVLQRAFKKIENRKDFKTLIVCGGVSANKRIREQLTHVANSFKLNVVFPPLKFCTDNAVMIGAAGMLQDSSLDLNDVQSRIPL